MNHDGNPSCGLIRDGLFANWKFGFDSDPRLHDLQLLVLELFHFVSYNCRSLWRTETIVVAKLNIPPPPSQISPRLYWGVLNRRFTGYKELINWTKLFIVFCTYLLFLWVLLFSTFLVLFGSMCARSKKCIFICLCIYLPHVLIVLYTSTLVKIILWSKIAAHECRQRFAGSLIFESATVLLRGSTIF